MAQYRVTCNAPDGFPGVFRGYPARAEGNKEGQKPDYPAGFGWFWPSKGIVIGVVDQDFDPPNDTEIPKGIDRLIGKLTWQALQDDPRIFAGPVNPIDGDAVTAALASAQAEIAELKAKLAAVTGADASAPAETPPAPSTSKSKKG